MMRGQVSKFWYHMLVGDIVNRDIYMRMHDFGIPSEKLVPETCIRVVSMRHSCANPPQQLPQSAHNVAKYMQLSV